ncbi:hypothetical protein [Mycolicibacterium senegalense]|uniref:hypothetical protein n=1 Tax=Mycolicibacterium senegalense TaxID=1796 RepID=UPI003AAD9F8C
MTSPSGPGLITLGATRASVDDRNERPLTAIVVTSANHLYGRMIAYHWSPSLRKRGIEERGLVIGAAPAVNAVQDSHRNPWISVSPTPSQAWWLSGGALEAGGLLDGLDGSSLWLLWEVDITGLTVQGDIANYPEYQVLENIAADRVTLIGQRSCERELGAGTPMGEAG